LRTRRSDSFTTITVAGHALPADLLQRIADKDKELAGLGADAFHLSPSETISEATSRAWNKLVAAWANFKSARQRLPANDPGTTVTRERWLLPLFQELGYGRLPASRSAVEIDGKGYAISHWWSSVPIHLVGVGVSIDKLSARIAGASRSSPHSLVQELLNRSEESLWGFVSNGSQLRILRDNQNLVRQAYVEFDLEAMMDGEAYSDFVMLWLLCHQSRVEGEKPNDYWLEKWSRAAQERGVRALEHLREGVEAAISLLGSGFLAHRANANLRDKLRSGLLDKQDYYRQLLRLVYRLLFVFVAEDRTDEKNRSLLLEPNASQEACDLYSKFYSTKKLRELAGHRHGSRHSDLYAGVRLVMEKLGSDGCAELALPALGSFLFSQNAIADLNEGEIANHDLLDAVRALAFATYNQARRQIDYKNLGSEELGSVYESLLELHPQLNIDAGTFALSTAAGHERKTTGSYYTPDSLVQCLLDSALDPVLNDREHGYAELGYNSQEEAILDLKVCDPACGSGHFLIAAAHRIAKRLASSRTGNDEPSPEATRHALRDVVGRCLYGVDINPMAVELCKVSLWMEGLEPGRPLSFLDHHILCGNSLLGTTPALINNGIPDEAFKPIQGDESEYCREYKRRNRDERRGQHYLPDVEHEPWRKLDNLATSIISIDEISDDTIEGVHLRQERYKNLVTSSGYRYGGLLADAWCAAFVWKKRKSDELPYPITQGEFRRIEENPFNVPTWMEWEIGRLARQYRFFHWHLAFPGVFDVRSGHPGENDQRGWFGGFDVVLGNPPWERVKLQEKEWFAARRPDIATTSNAATRRRMIDALRTEDPSLHEAFLEDRRTAEGESHLIRNTGRYPLCGRGDVNTYAVFAETMRLVQSGRGYVGCIVPTGIATDDTTKLFIQDLMESKQLVSLYSFFEIRLLFPATDSRNPFCLLTIGGADRPAPEGAEFVFSALRPSDLDVESKRFKLSANDIALLNPNTRTCPVFRSKRDAEITKTIYRSVPVLINRVSAQEDVWGAHFLRMFDMTNDSNSFRTREQLEAEGLQLEKNIFSDLNREVLPLYEAKFLHQFDHRWATSDGVETHAVSITEKSDPEFSIMPRYWIAREAVRDRLNRWHCGWLLAYRLISRPSDEHTLISSVIPFAGCGNSAPLILVSDKCALLISGLIANLSSHCLDYVTRQKLGGANLSFVTIEQLPVLSPSTYSEHRWWSKPEPLGGWIESRVLELVYTSWDLEAFARELGFIGCPFRWDQTRRFLLRCELDAAYFHLYDVARDDVDYIMESFTVAKQRDEQKHGEYRTKRVILEIYDEIAQAMDTGQSYQTRLDPPPADPRVAHLPRLQPVPLVLPTVVRYPQPDAGVYMMRVILSILRQNNGSIDVERLMNACELLAMPDRLETYGSTIEPSLAHQWRSSFNDQLRPDLFLAKIDDLVQRGEIRLTRDGTRFKVARIGTAVLPSDAYIDFDARFALRVNDSLPQAEKDALTPLATRDQIEERTRAA
jgi:hypothetical protein